MNVSDVSSFMQIHMFSLYCTHTVRVSALDNSVIFTLDLSTRKSIMDEELSWTDTLANIEFNKI